MQQLLTEDSKAALAAASRWEKSADNGDLDRSGAFGHHPSLL